MNSETFDFLATTKIEGSTTEYIKKLDEYVKNVKTIFNSRKCTLFQSSKVTFYYHALRFYFPKIAKVTLERHSLGVGIFLMQGFERQNKESKNTLARFSTFNRNNKEMKRIR